LTALIFDILKDIQPGRLIESLIFLAVLMWKIKPHLKRVEDRMAGIETAMKAMKDSVTMGFAQGNARFTRIETRLDLLEHKPKNDDKVVSDGAKDH
jgi:hypothetical protein